MTKAIPTGNIISSGQDTFFQSIHLFTNQICDQVVLKGEEVVLKNVVTCLRDAALQWHSIELSKFEQDALRSMSINNWCSWITH